MANWKIPLADLDIGAEEAAVVLEVLRSRWLTQGERTKEFERRFADYVGAKHAFAVANCTAALHLAYAALGLGPGDEVIMPALTFVATANTALAVGARPVFADVASVQDWTLSPEDLARRITPQTRALAVVHYAGYAADMSAIVEVARAHGLAVVEDCAHSPGAVHKGKHLGTWGDIGCFSFFSNKNMTTGEGGMVVTDRDDLAEQLRLLRSHGMTTLTWDRHRGHAYSYDVVMPGFNYRLDEIRAAIGLVQLEKLNANNARREALVRRYQTALQHVPGVGVPFAGREDTAFHIMPILLPEGVKRRAVIDSLRAQGIQTSIHYPPVHTFSYFRAHHPASLPLTEHIGERTLTLPLFPAMTDLQVTEVVEALRAALALQVAK